jgi:deoxyribodipyrimidine photo-lyase
MDHITLVWLRRDLRLHDHAALFHALKERSAVLPVFIFDRYILDELDDRNDPRVTFIHDELSAIKHQLEHLGSSLLVLHGHPEKIFEDLMDLYSIEAVYFNRDYEPRAIERDHRVRQILEQQQVEVRSFKDQVIFEGNEVCKSDGKPYTVYTPYMKRWKAAMGYEKPGHFALMRHDVMKHASCFYRTKPFGLPSLKTLGFERSQLVFPDRELDEQVIKNYDARRDYPALNGTTRLGVHLRFGTISIRQAVQTALELNETWLNELIWREFFMMILLNFPAVVDQSFKIKYDEIEWRNDESDFQAWAAGETGYPLVDAGMRELNQTGYMHNRVRMVTASFLTKHLLIDWRWGESYFAGKLLDYELASNNGGWQWAAGSGCDAAPYFRIFNPQRQAGRFDPQGHYVARWVPEFFSGNYRNPMVDHKFARERALQVYQKAVKK